MFNRGRLDRWGFVAATEQPEPCHPEELSATAMELGQIKRRREDDFPWENKTCNECVPSRGTELVSVFVILYFTSGVEIQDAPGLETRTGSCRKYCRGELIFAAGW